MPSFIIEPALHTRAIDILLEDMTVQVLPLLRLVGNRQNLLCEEGFKRILQNP